MDGKEEGLQGRRSRARIGSVERMPFEHFANQAWTAGYRNLVQMSDEEYDSDVFFGSSTVHNVSCILFVISVFVAVLSQRG